MSYATFEKIQVSSEEIRQCSYSQWYPKLKEHVVKSIILKPLPKTFLQYLAGDSIKLAGNHSKIEANSDNEYSEWESDSGDDSEPAHSLTVDSFAELHRQIGESIAELGGHVTPKLNWSAPKDAKWIMPGSTTQCREPNDVYLLLNASDHVVDDLDYPFSAADDASEAPPVDYELVLRKWKDVNPALEFRVFVQRGRILGISQRDLNHYDFLEGLQQELREVIDEFIHTKVDGVLGLDKYIVDVYVPRPFKKVYIVDINPFTRKSDSLLFTWNELLLHGESDSPDYQLRIVTKTNMGRFAQKEYSESQVPLDVVDASTNSETMVALAREWAQLQMKE